MKIFRRPHREVTLSVLWLSVLILLLGGHPIYSQLSPACLSEYTSIPTTPIIYVGTALMFAIVILSGVILADRIIAILEGDWSGAHE